MLQEQIEIDWTKLDTNTQQFIRSELDKCRHHSIKITIPKKRNVLNNDTGCAGYFESNPLEFAVAVGRSHRFWLNTFVHESCHMDQWIEQIPIWNQEVNGQDPLDLLDLWLQNKIELEQSTLNDIFDIVTEIELDCEIRSVEKIKQWNLPIKLDTYIKKSNAYIWSYRLLQTTRTWDHTGAYEFPEVWRKMPRHFNNDYSCLPDNISQILYANIERIAPL